MFPVGSFAIEASRVRETSCPITAEYALSSDPGDGRLFVTSFAEGDVPFRDIRGIVAVSALLTP